MYSDQKILILGAGMSGVSAVKKLKELGYGNFEIIEGSGRAGGRLYHLTMGDVTVEMGPMVVHGVPDNPVLALLRKYNVSIQETNYDDWKVRARNGTDVTIEASSIYEERWGPAVQNMASEANTTVYDHRPDFTLRSAFLKGGWEPKSFLDDIIEYYEIDWLYGFGPEETSAKFTDFAKITEFNEDIGDSFVKDDRGYALIVQNLLDEVLGNNTDRLHLDKVVTGIEAKDDNVIVTTEANETYTADYIIVTFSLGVLQSDLVKFKPELPEWKTDAIQQFQMAQYTTVHIQFNTSFWDDREWILYADDTEAFNLILNMNKLYPGCNILSLEASNKASVRIERLSSEEVQQEVVNKLQKIYSHTGVTVPAPVNFRMSRFSQYPLFRGAWTNWPPGYTRDSHYALQAPVSRIYFAGEHTHFPYYGYLQGAYLSGEEIGDKLDKCIQLGVCQKYVPVYAARGCRYTAASNYDHRAKQDDGSCMFSCVSASEQYRGSVLIILVTVMISLIYSYTAGHS